MHTLQQLQSGELKGIKSLKLLNCNLTQFPTEIFELADSLEILDLSSNQLSSLPSDFGRLNKLKIVFFSDNLFTVLPEVLTDCPQLEMIGFKANHIKQVSELSIHPNTRWLILTNNQITRLPSSIGKCTRLQKCMLAGNQLSELPVEMANCKNIELLRLAANKFESFPEWLFNLPRLSWLAIAGNPCTKLEGNSQSFLEEISWNDLKIENLLGEGASGKIYKAICSDNKEVAVKVFKGEVTSDGLPEDEMKATIAVGNHPNIVKVIGKIVNHSEQKQGLVFELIPSNYTNLAGPPSFETCTRDVFKADFKLSYDEAYNIVKSMASAAKHLHQKGIMHGDLYAHNILIDEHINTLFGDFGGAMMYKKQDFWSIHLEKIEVRAFGCLVDDLLSQIKIKENRIEILVKLRDKCWDENVLNRISFEEIEALLN